MKNYLVIGNPIDHSLSPKIHNYWIKKNNINANYSKKLVTKDEIEQIILQVRKGEIDGINVTVPHKKTVISYVDDLSPEAKQSKSVNTIYKENNKVIGHNTDIAGFELSLRNTKFDISNKKVLILGAGGVVSSIIIAIKRMKPSKIMISNRTKQKAENLSVYFKDIEIVNWGETPEFDMIVNATSIGLNKDDKIELNYNQIGSKKFFYDIIYNPKETNFLKKAKEFGNRTENGKMMFIYQAHQAFTIWHKVMPEIHDEIIKLIDND